MSELRTTERKLHTFTHKGWFGICPVYLSALHSESPVVDPRWSFVEWLMPLSEWVYGMLIWLRSTFEEEYEPMWPIAITGELHPPITR